MEQRAHRSQDHHTRHQRQEAQTLRHCGGGGAQATQLVMSYVTMFSNYDYVILDIYVALYKKSRQASSQRLSKCSTKYRLPYKYFVQVTISF